jgi:hypothetical protein
MTVDINSNTGVGTTCKLFTFYTIHFDELAAVDTTARTVQTHRIFPVRQWS